VLQESVLKAIEDFKSDGLSYIKANLKKNTAEAYKAEQNNDKMESE
jgi:hypothetical protein